MNNLEKDIETLKKMIYEFFLIPFGEPDEYIKQNQKETLSLLYQLGYGSKVDETLLENIWAGKEDENIKKAMKRLRNQSSQTIYQKKYSQYLQRKINPLELKFLITKYLVNQKNHLLKQEELDELKQVITILLERLGYSPTNLNTENLKEYITLLEKKSEKEIITQEKEAIIKERLGKDENHVLK